MGRLGRRVRLALAILALALSWACATMPNGQVHVMQRGENLFRIARHYRVPVSDIVEANQIDDVTDIPVGTLCELLCPVSGKSLPRVGDVGDGSDAVYHAIYLTPKLSKGSMVCVSDIWGHYHSRIVDDFELISAWSNEEK